MSAGVLVPDVETSAHLDTPIKAPVGAVTMIPATEMDDSSYTTSETADVDDSQPCSPERGAMQFDEVVLEEGVAGVGPRKVMNFEDCKAPRHCPTVLHTLYWALIDGPVTFLLLTMISAPLTYWLITAAVFVVLMAHCHAYVYGLLLLSTAIIGWVVPTSCVPRSSQLIRCWVMRQLVRYFDATAVFDRPEEFTSGMMVVQSPHGMYPFGTLLLSYMSEVVTETPGYCLAASSIFLLPLYRYFILGLGGVPATKGSVGRAAKKGGHCSVAVGGLAEMFMVRDDVEEVLMRRGFIREAIKNGYDLIPIYFFNVNRTFKYIGPPIFTRCCEYLSRVTGIPLCFYRGRYGLPIPYRVPIKMAIGPRVYLQQCDHPTAEAVEGVYKQYVRELESLYYRHRPKGDVRPLIVVDSYERRRRRRGGQVGLRSELSRGQSLGAESREVSVLPQ